MTDYEVARRRGGPGLPQGPARRRPARRRLLRHQQGGRRRAARRRRRPLRPLLRHRRRLRHLHDAGALHAAVVPHLQRRVFPEVLIPSWYYGLIGLLRPAAVEPRAPLPLPAPGEGAAPPRPAAAAHDPRRRRHLHQARDGPRPVRAAPGEPKEFWLVEGAKHNQALHVAGDEYRRRVLEFFERHLAGGDDRPSGVERRGRDAVLTDASGEPGASATGVRSRTSGRSRSRLARSADTVPPFGDSCHHARRRAIRRCASSCSASSASRSPSPIGRRLAQFEAATHDPREVQEALLRDILAPPGRHRLRPRPPLRRHPHRRRLPPQRARRRLRVRRAVHGPRPPTARRTPCWPTRTSTCSP